MTLLYIDDDEDDREIFREAVSLVHGLTLITSNGMGSAFEILKSQFIDIIFIDYRMPGIDGREFLLELKKEQLLRENTRVYFYATFMQDFEKRECVAIGARDCFEKPSDVGEISRIIKTVVFD